MAAQLAITKADIEQAMERIAGSVRTTPTLEVSLMDCVSAATSSQMSIPGSVVFKLEYLQHSGSFKARGAFNNLLARDTSSAGVVAASGGNHGAAVAFAASQLGIPAHIFVPRISAPAKQKRIEQLGAKLVVEGDCYADALAAAIAFQAETGAIAIHAYDAPETLAGAGTTAIEVSQQIPNLDTVLIAVGGGGLIGGMATYLGDNVKVIAVETQGTATLHEALKAGHPVDIDVSGIAADSLGARRIGSLSFPILQRYVNESVLISDDEVKRAQGLLWRDFRIASEAGGAVAFAALSSGKYQPSPDEKVAVIICGANTGAVSYSDV